MSMRCALLLIHLHFLFGGCVSTMHRRGALHVPRDNTPRHHEQRPSLLLQTRAAVAHRWGSNSTPGEEDESHFPVRHRQYVCNPKWGDAANPAKAMWKTTKVFNFSNALLLLGEKLVWCPNAKVGTTTMYTSLKKMYGINTLQRCHPGNKCRLHFDNATAHIQLDLQTVQDKDLAKKLCGKFSVTFIRNPFERVRSAYNDKIISGWISPDYTNHTMTFTEFVRFIGRQRREDPSGQSMNPHWQPYSTTCNIGNRPENFPYSKVYRMEDGFERQLKEAFIMSGIKSELTSDLSILDELKPNSNTEHTFNSREQQYLEAPGLRYPRELVDIVYEAYADDIAFGRYTFEVI